MAKKAASPSPPKIYCADAPAASNGAVYYFGPELTVAEAVEHRRNGGNVVVRGSDKKQNLRTAQEIEDGVGTWQRDQPHKNSAGQAALPHYHQQPNAEGERVPAGHTFYEVDKSKAKKKP